MPVGIYARPSGIERLLNKISVVESGCWEWQGFIKPDGYGEFHLGGKLVYVHRFAYEYFNNTKIPNKMHIDHLCRNKRCINPDRLEVVTCKENNRRGICSQTQRVRLLSITHCAQGHPFNEVNTYIAGNGKRRCRICRAKWHKSWVNRQRELEKLNYEDYFVGWF